MDTTARVTILIADDHPVFREGLKRLLEAEPDFVVVGEADDGERAIERAAHLRPMIVLLDVSMPRRTGLDTLEDLVSAAPSCRVILLTAGITRNQILTALRHGARGVVLKEAASTLLYKAIRAVAAGQYWVGRECMSDLISLLSERSSPDRADVKYGLTPRELQVVAAVVAGYTNRDIARRFMITEDTVKHHVSHVFDKLGVSSRLELALFAVNHELISREQTV